jgi:two-component system response regulator VicR
MKILLVDDDRDHVDLIAFSLRRVGLTPVPAYDRPTALGLFETQEPDLVVLDINLGVWDGLDLLKEVRRRSQVPVLMLTARDTEDDKVRGLELGADDYLTKPFGHRELVARIRVQLRRRGQVEGWSAPKAAESQLQVGPLRLNPAEHSAVKEGRTLLLTVTEFRLLHYLMLNAGSVVRTPALLKQVWGHADPGGADVVRVTVHRLRRKLEEDPSNPRLLHTVPGVGVMLKPGPGEPPSPSRV